MFRMKGYDSKQIKKTISKIKKDKINNNNNNNIINNIDNDQNKEEEKRIFLPYIK